MLARLKKLAASKERAWVEAGVIRGDDDDGDQSKSSDASDGSMVPRSHYPFVLFIPLLLSDPYPEMFAADTLLRQPVN
jgi:hypothetical protein